MARKRMNCFVGTISGLLLFFLSSQAIFAATHDTRISSVSTHTGTANPFNTNALSLETANNGKPKLFSLFSLASDSSFVITLSGGPVWGRGGQTQTFFLAPEMESTYVANKSTQVPAFNEIFLGIQRQLGKKSHGQLGFAVATTGDANFTGHIWDDADPRFDNYIYKYKVKHTHLVLKAKLLADIGCFVMPWISAGAGVGFNKSHGYSDRPLIFEAVGNPAFASHTQTSFTYSLGAGFQRQLSRNWQAGIGYEFADWGKSKLGRAQGQTFSRRLGVNYLYTNGLLLNISYLA